MEVTREVSILALNAFETRSAFNQSKIGTNVGQTRKRTRAFDNEWVKTKRAKLELNQVDPFVNQIDEVCNTEGIRKPNVPDNMTIDDLIADIDKAIAEKKIMKDALLGHEKAHPLDPKLEMKK